MAQYLQDGEAQQFSAAHYPGVLEKFRDRLQDIDVRCIEVLHDQVRPFFRRGPHKGENVRDLVRGLTHGIVDPSQVPPITVLKMSEDCFHVVFGSSRLMAFKEFQKACGQTVTVRALVSWIPPVYYRTKFWFVFSACLP